MQDNQILQLLFVLCPDLMLALVYVVTALNKKKTESWSPDVVTYLCTTSQWVMVYLFFNKFLYIFLLLHLLLLDKKDDLGLNLAGKGGRWGYEHLVGMLGFYLFIVLVFFSLFFFILILSLCPCVTHLTPQYEAQMCFWKNPSCSGFHQQGATWARVVVSSPPSLFFQQSCCRLNPFHSPLNCSCPSCSPRPPVSAELLKRPDYLHLNGKDFRFSLQTCCFLSLSLSQVSGLNLSSAAASH